MTSSAPAMPAAPPAKVRPRPGGVAGASTGGRGCTAVWLSHAPGPVLSMSLLTVEASLCPTRVQVKGLSGNGKLAPMPSVKQDAVQEIKDRLDLVDLISEHLRLQKAGRDLKGLCPFHQEKTPSLYVSPEKQLWHCYGCQKGGDHFTFIMDIEHVLFKDALRLPAETTGRVRRQSPGAGRQRELKRTIARLNLLAAQYFHHILLENPAGQKALIQLESRGVTRG